MKNPWFRLYAEFSHDPKVQSMPEAMQRRLVMIMCLRCSNEIETLHETEIAFALRVTDAELSETKALFIAKGFIDDAWKLLHWDKRQYASDSSTARVRAHRANKRNADVTACNVSVTSPDTDTDTEREKEKNTKKKNQIELPEWIPAAEWRDYVEMRQRIRKPMTVRAVEIAIHSLELLKSEGHDPARVLEQSVFNSWQGLFALKGGITNGKSNGFIAEGKRLAAKYGEIAEREAQGATGGNPEPDLRDSAEIRHH